jgi:GntR family transcriptional regulator / MocR family aminotransferase
MLVSLRGDGPINQRVYRSLRRAILDGRVAAGARLPSTRTLAVDLGVSRKAVAFAFMRLVDEGYVEARVGAGTYVSATLPDAALAPWKGRRGAPLTQAAPIRLSSHARRVLAQRPFPPPGVRSAKGLRYEFHYGSPAIADFPQDTWCRLVAERARGMSMRTLRYGRTLGFDGLRRVMAQYLTRARGVVANEDQIVIVNGSQQALDLTVRSLVDPGDAVIIEEPGYQGARQVLVAAGARVIPTRVDDAGLDVSRLPRGRDVRLAYVTPSHQFPLGGVLPLARRLTLLKWAEETRAYIVEDDYDSEFRYEGHPIEAVQGLDRAGRVVYVGTFSKVLFPSLRLAYLVVPPSLVPAIAALKFLTDYHTPTFEQAVLADFIAEGHFERHLRRTRRRNAGRRQALLEAVRDHLGDRAEVVGANAGVHVVVWLRDFDVSRLDELKRRAAERSVGIYPVTPYYMRAPRRAGLLFGYASLAERDIREGIALLGDVLRTFPG